MTASTLKTQDSGGKDDRWLRLEESPSCTERGCPVKAGEAFRRRQSRLARFGARATETVPISSGNRGAGVKRAILPAAISDSAVIRLLAKAGSREQPFPRGAAGLRTERDDHHEQNSAYSLSILLPIRVTYNVVLIAQLVRALVCGTRGWGFKSPWAPHNVIIAFKRRLYNLEQPSFCTC